MTHNTHKFWLKMAAVLVACFGPLFFLASAGVTEPVRFALDILSWPIDGAQQYSDSTLRFVSALTGGFLMGWGVMIWCLSAWVYDLAPELVRKSLLAGILSWFIFDSSGSVASGNAANVGFNVLVLLIGVGPMWFPARENLAKKS